MPEQDRATDVGTCTKIGKDRTCGSGDILPDRQTDIDILITILRRCSGRSNHGYVNARGQHGLDAVFIQLLSHLTKSDAVVSCAVVL